MDVFEDQRFGGIEIGQVSAAPQHEMRPLLGLAQGIAELIEIVPRVAKRLDLTLEVRLSDSVRSGVSGSWGNIAFA